MTDHPASNPTPTPTPTPTSVPTLLRLAADGELSASQRAELDAHLARQPQDVARIEFELGLRGAVAGALRSGTPAADPALRERVRAVLREAPTGEPSVRTHDAGRSIPMPSMPRARRRVLPGVWALAAVLLLGVGLGVVLGPSLWSSGTGPILPRAGFGTRLATFATKEHGRCAVGSRYARSKLKVTDIRRVPEQFAELVGEDTSLVDLANRPGFTFLGAGRCALPGRTSSVHVQLLVRLGDADVPVSLWIKPDAGEIDMSEGITYEAVSSRPGASPAYVWKRGGHVFVLVADTSAAADEVRTALGSDGPAEAF